MRISAILALGALLLSACVSNSENSTNQPIEPETPAAVTVECGDLGPAQAYIDAHTERFAMIGISITKAHPALAEALTALYNNEPPASNKEPDHVDVHDVPVMPTVFFVLVDEKGCAIGNFEMPRGQFIVLKQRTQA